MQLAESDLRENYQKGHRTNLKGYSSTTLDRNRAISYAIGENDSDLEIIPVLMIIKFRGKKQFFYLNSMDYSAYPYEEEILLQEGCAVYILAINRDRQIKNSYKGMEKYNGKSITIVHLFHDS